MLAEIVVDGFEATMNVMLVRNEKEDISSASVMSMYQIMRSMHCCFNSRF